LTTANSKKLQINNPQKLYPWEEQLHLNLSTLNLIENQANQLDFLTSQVTVTLIEPIDGDTINVVYRKVENIRYLLADTPESKKAQISVSKSM
jgi:endonuclease YncB( thermonuclease family)